MNPGEPFICLLVSMDPPPVHVRHGWAFNVHVIVTVGHLDGLAAEEAELAVELLWRRLGG